MVNLMLNIEQMNALNWQKYKKNLWFYVKLKGRAAIMMINFAANALKRRLMLWLHNAIIFYSAKTVSKKKEKRWLAASFLENFSNALFAIKVIATVKLSMKIISNCWNRCCKKIGKDFLLCPIQKETTKWLRYDEIIKYWSLRSLII